MDFDTAFNKLIKLEGGYSNHPDDKGGETQWGITLAVARANGYQGKMQDFPQTQAKAIYKKLYWDAVKADQLPIQLRYAIFDAAVNSGATQSIKWLQQALNTHCDGVLGNLTLKACQEAIPHELLLKLLAKRLYFMTNLPSWPSFSKGWTRRIVELMQG